MGRYVVATGYVADHESNTSLKGFFELYDPRIVEVIVNRGGVVEVRKAERLGKVLPQVTR